MLILEGGKLILNDEGTEEFNRAIRRMDESHIVIDGDIKLIRKKGKIYVIKKFTGNLRLDDVLRFAWGLEPGDTWELPFVLGERNLKNRLDAARPKNTMKERKVLFVVTKEGRQQVQCQETPF